MRTPRDVLCHPVKGVRRPWLCICKVNDVDGIAFRAPLEIEYVAGVEAVRAKICAGCPVPFSYAATFPQPKLQARSEREEMYDRRVAFSWSLPPKRSWTVPKG
jgi:hypothetical protein